MGSLNHCRVEGGVVEGGVLNHCVVLPGAVVSGGVRNHDTIGSDVRYGHGAPQYFGSRQTPTTISFTFTSGWTTSTSSASSTSSVEGQPLRAEVSRPRPGNTPQAGPPGTNSAFEASSSNVHNRDTSEHPPSHLIDHIISFDLINEAVMTPSGHTYDRKIIERHISEHRKCPMTRQRPARKDLRPNRVLQQLINDWKSQRGAVLPDQ